MPYYGDNLLGLIDPKKPETYMTNPFPKGFEKVTTPEGASGDWRVERFTVSDKDIGLYNLRLIRDGRLDRVLPPGTYTRLVSKYHGIVMSDTPAEAWEHNSAFKCAEGNILINGLGLGFYLRAVMNKPEVRFITVIEKSADVIKLVGDYMNSPRLEIIEADAFEWQPPKGVKYDYVWHDIWPSICHDNKAEMTRLKRKYGRRAKLQGCWSWEYM